MSDPQEIKLEVRNRYAGIARKQSPGCASAATDCGGDKLVELQMVDYSDLRQQGVPEADLGLGCGTPTVWAQIQEGETVLDLGCGAGIDMFLSARAVGATGRVIGVDMTPEMLTLAQRNADRGGFTNVRFMRGDLEHLALAAASVDVVLSNCVINLVPDKAVVYKQIYRLLRPGGRFAISDMVTYGEVPATVRQDMALWSGCIAGAMERETYLDLIREIGFGSVRVVAESQHDAAEYLPVDESGFGIASVTVVGEKTA